MIEHLLMSVGVDEVPDYDGPLGLFYGGLIGSARQRFVSRIASNLTLVSEETELGGLGRDRSGAARSGANALFCAGNTTVAVNTRLYLSERGTVVLSELSSGNIARTRLSGGYIGDHSFMYGGSPSALRRRLEKFSGTTVVSNIDFASTYSKEQASSASLDVVMIFLGGISSAGGRSAVFIDEESTVTNYNSTILPAALQAPAGANIGNLGIFYGGYAAGYSGIAHKVTADNTIVSTESTVGVGDGRYMHAGASVDNLAMFHGGNEEAARVASAFMLNDNLVAVVVTSAVGTARTGHAGVGVL